MSGYAFLNEIWTEEKETTHAPPQCSLYKTKDGSRQIDNIMDAYMSEPKPICQEESSTIVQEEARSVPKVCWDNGNIEGYGGSSLLKNAYSFDSYYKDELDNITAAKESKVINDNNVKETLCEDEAFSPPSITREEIYRNLIEKYEQQQTNTNSSQQNSYIELGIYIFSGIIIIFLMEQILQIGRSMR